jgi:hypothetical protein
VAASRMLWVGGVGLGALALGSALTVGIVHVAEAPLGGAVPAVIELRRSGPGATPEPSGPGGVGQDRSRGPGLVTFAVTGRLERCGDEHCLNGTELDFGPPWYLSAARAPQDLDGDGRVETLAREIEGLVGATITVTVEQGRHGELDGFAIDGVFYRDEIGPPPWAGGPHCRSGDAWGPGASPPRGWPTEGRCEPCASAG